MEERTLVQQAEDEAIRLYNKTFPPRAQLTEYVSNKDIDDLGDTGVENTGPVGLVTYQQQPLTEKLWMLWGTLVKLKNIECSDLSDRPPEQPTS
jgi:hypothetical protein